MKKTILLAYVLSSLLLACTHQENLADKTDAKKTKSRSTRCSKT